MLIAVFWACYRLVRRYQEAKRVEELERFISLNRFPWSDRRHERDYRPQP
jgi:hypothetical protein